MLGKGLCRKMKVNWRSHVPKILKLAMKSESAKVKDALGCYQIKESLGNMVEKVSK